MKTITVKNKTEKTLQKYLQDEFPLLRTGILSKSHRLNKIKVNSKKIPLDRKLRQGDEISLYIGDELLIKPNKTNYFLFSGDSLDIVYEDDNLLVVNKPAGIPVTDENTANYDTLINRVKKYYKNTNVTPALCHRLDTGTSGLVLIAKNRDFSEYMLGVFKNHLIKKEYVCLTYGIPQKNHSLHSAYLTKNARESYVTITQKPKSKDSKPIETEIFLNGHYDNYSYLTVNLITGRTHQIRAHLSYLGLPILGDSKYGNNSLNRKLKLKYQLLCSKTVQFGVLDDKRYSYLSNMRFTAPDPWFIEAFINRKL